MVPPEIHPADTTISRVAREMQKRMLCVPNISRVKALQFQLSTSQKKRKLSDGLFIEDGEDEEVVAHDRSAVYFVVGLCHGWVRRGDRCARCGVRVEPGGRYHQVRERAAGYDLQVLLPSQAQHHSDAHGLMPAVAPDTRHECPTDKGIYQLWMEMPHRGLAAGS